MQARYKKAEEYSIEVLDRAVDGVKDKTAVHICFGYGFMVKGKPGRYAFLPELAATRVAQVSIEAAQPKLDATVLEELPGKTVIFGVLDLSTSEVETPDAVAGRIRQALPHIDPSRLIIAPDCGLKYLTREVAFGKLKAMVDGVRIVRGELARTSAAME